MLDSLTQSVFFGAVLTLAGYEAGLYCKKRWHLAIFNPILIATALAVALLAVLKIPYSVYYSGAKYISYLLTPATVCLAIPLYEQLELLKKNAAAILAGICAGVLTSVTMVLLGAMVFHFQHWEYVTFLPKSITTAIGMGVSEQLGGNVSITVVVIILTGVLGNILAEPICRLFSIKNPIARGIGIGSASHAVGTDKAMELGQVEGAMSGLSIAVSGLLTVAAAAVFSMLH